MNCPFCWQVLYFDGYVLDNSEECESYSCNSIACLVNTEFPRYKCVVDRSKALIQEEYCMGDIYVKVYPDYSLIYHLVACMLDDQILIQRPLFINPTNTQQTLDKLRMLVMFS